MSVDSRPSLFKRFQSIYADAAMTSFNFMVMFVVVNLVIGFSYSFIDQSKRAAAIVQTKAQGRPPATSQRDSWQLEHIDLDGYGDVPQAQVEKVLDDSNHLVRKGLVYQPWVQFAAPAFQSATVNVDVDPEDSDFTIRRTVETAEDNRPVIDVYLFGGSTAFGFNSADEWTVASYLSKEMQDANPKVRVRVRNFGRLLYYSTQEVVLFDRLVRAGHRPQVVVFLDGLNDTIFMSGLKDQPNLTPKLADLLETQQIGRKGNGLQDYSWIPLVRLAYTIRARITGHEDINRPVLPPVPAVDKSTDFVLRTYRLNVQAAKRLADASGIHATFVWQPVPFYHYDMSLHRTPPLCPQNVRDVYTRVYDTMRTEKDIVFLGDAFQEFGSTRKVFVDDVHYGPAFSQFLAKKIAQSIDLTDIKPHP